MNKIFNRVVELENAVNDLYLDVNNNKQPYNCPHNKKEILDQLIFIEKEVTKIIRLNRENCREEYKLLTRPPTCGIL